MLSYEECNDLWELSEASPTGLIWKRDLVMSNSKLKRMVGKVAGTMQNRKGTHKRPARLTEKYWAVRYNGKGYKAHRVVYFIANGTLADDLVIDHLDGNGLNNSIGNLRLTTKTINSRNVRKSIRNTSGVQGVSVQYAKPGKHGQKYYRVSYTELDGTKRWKLFSTALGDSEAFQAAIIFRLAMINELNIIGAGYTERHGGLNG